jgi:4a-hydroxytetrahydrobiopterin dehydratase
MKKLSQEDIEARLSEFPEWSQNGDSLQRTFGFDNFAGAMLFVNRVADLAEHHQHHPDIMIRYNKVTLTLSTHDAKGITENDFDLANDLDAAVAAGSR